MSGVTDPLLHTPSWGHSDNFSFTLNARNNSFGILLSLLSKNNFRSDCGLCILLDGECFVGTSYVHLNVRMAVVKTQ